MINLERKTKLTPEEAVKRLKGYFGKDGLGLDLTEGNDSCLSFSGGGGYVKATICLEGGKTLINLVAQEWEYQAKEFLSELP